ncbi:MAG: SAM-dependent DNA methyltransferase [Geobacter sp.]|nr:SAM-dependent DNA methyltransferase [Geobacter sp.]
MLNGSKGNFCLDVSGTSEGTEKASLAWSADVGHYVQVLSNEVNVVRWDRPNRPEKIPTSVVRDNLQRFQEYLSADQPARESSIVSHASSAFRRLRMALGSGVSGGDSLKAFLILLASAKEDASIQSLDLERWGLDSAAVEIVARVPRMEFEAVSLSLRRGKADYNLVPNFDLILRHAAGPLFQEAHYIALTNAYQMSLFDAPPPATIIERSEGIGVHFTPPSLARAIVEESLSHVDLRKAEITVFDPACGSGEFLKEALRQLHYNGFEGKINLIGWDISEPACYMTRFVLTWEKRGSADRIKTEISCVDALDGTEWPTDVDILLMNPPFMSWPNMTKYQQDKVKSILGILMQKRPDMASAFIVRAINSLKEEGVLGAVVPASFLESQSLERVREGFLTTLDLRLVAKLGSQKIFSRAIVDAAVTVGKKTATRNNIFKNLWADHNPDSNESAFRALRIARANNQGQLEKNGFSIYTRRQDSNTYINIAPKPEKSRRLAEKLSHLPRVGELFSVQQGTITGLNEAFVLDAPQYNSLPKKERQYFRPAIMNESIANSMILSNSFVFYPYVSGGIQLKEESEVRRAVPQYFQLYLQPFKQKLLTRARVTPDQWWRLSEYRAWQVNEVPKVVSTYFGDRGSFAFDREGKIVVVQGYGWSPKGGRSLTDEAGYAYAAFLASDVASVLLSFVSVHVGGGQWNLSKRYVEKMPIPNFFDDDATTSTIINDFGKAGRKISAGDQSALAEVNGLVATYLHVEI